MRQACCVVLFLCLLSACSSSNKLSENEKFDSESTDAVLIVGIRNLPDNGLHHYLHWLKIDPSNNTLIVKNRVSVVTRLSSWHDSKVMYYEVHKVPAGTYAIESVFGGAAPKINYEVKLRPETYVVSVAPGEVVYVGNFEVSVKVERTFWTARVDPKLRYVGADMPAAAEKLKSYPNVKGPIIYRKPASAGVKFEPDK